MVVVQIARIFLEFFGEKVEEGSSFGRLAWNGVALAERREPNAVQSTFGSFQGSVGLTAKDFGS